MGNAFVAVADDKNALWYNPAGLSRVTGYHFDLVDAVGGVDSLDTLGRIARAMTGSGYSSALRADKEFARVGVFPSFLCPNFGVSLYADVQTFLEIENFSLPEVDLYGANDLGLAAGFSLPLSRSFALGVSARVIHRVGMDLTMSSQGFLSSLPVSQTDFTNAVYDTIRGSFGRGLGIGVTLGAMLDVPVKKSERLGFGLTVEDIGQTSFHGDAGSSPPPPIRSSVNLGSAWTKTFSPLTQLTLALDLRNLTDGLTFIKTFHLGAELRVGQFELRLGANQGYLSLGFGIDTPFARAELVTYAVELGEGPWDRFHRWYLFQISLGLDRAKM